jgi:hypothetical protein
MNLKLNELIASHSHASNRLIVVEELSAEELDTLKNFYIKLSQLAKKDSDIHQTHSIEEASVFHEEKSRHRMGGKVKRN